MTIDHRATLPPSPSAVAPWGDGHGSMGQHQHGLFDGIQLRVPGDAPQWALHQPSNLSRCIVAATVGPRTVEIFERVEDLDDALSLRNLYVGRVEAELGPAGCRPELAERWRSARRCRHLSPDDVLGLTVTSRFVKALFNFYFRDDLYGVLRRPDNVVLSSGAALETHLGLPPSLKACITYAIERDWYGYSDSRGRQATRQAIARLENVKVPGAGYTDASISVTMGGTSAMSSVADLVLSGPVPSPALILAPNYPPLVEAVARRAPIRIVPTTSGAGRTDLAPLLAALRPDTPLVMLQSVSNPTGVRVDESQLEALITAAGPDTLIVIDEAHECSGPALQRSPLRAATNVVRLVSLSKSLSTPGLKLGWLVAAPEVNDAFYEYASTSYGGPPSVFALLLEVEALFERWLLEDLEDVGPEQRAELELAAQLDLTGLAAAYVGYRDEVTRRDRQIVASRAWAEAVLAHQGFEPVTADYSLNVAARVPGSADSYGFFRTALHRTGTSLYPGVLNLLFDDPVVRVTTARPMDELARGIGRLGAAVPGRSATRSGDG